MTGISWGGFNALQVAARRPPALKAIIANCATDDRYADDIHYMGGALLTEQEMWSNFMLVKKAMAPDPQIVGDAWRDMWVSRLDGDSSLSEVWLAHQRRDDYWRQGSVCEDHSAIECAVHGRLRLGGQLFELRAAPARTSARAEARHRRAVVARLSLPRRAGAADRLSAGGAALVAALARAAKTPASWTSRSTASGSPARSGRSPSTCPTMPAAGPPRINGRRRASSAARCI